MLKKVLFPTDLSPLSRQSLAWMADTLLRKGSEVILLHVVDPVLGTDTPLYVREAEEETERLAQSLEPWGIKGIPLVLAGQEREIIPRTAFSRNCTLTIHVAPSRDEAELMVQHLGMPQLILTADTPSAPGANLLRHLALALDLAPERTNRLLEELERFLNGEKPVISLVHVVALEDTLSANGLIVAAEQALEEVSETVRLLAKDVQTTLGSGNPEEELPKIIEGLAPSMLVAGLSRHSELWELLLGNTALSLLRRVRCPLLLLPL